MPDGEYWFTVAVKNSGSQVIGLQSGPVQAGCPAGQGIYLPIISKGEGGGSSGPQPPDDCSWQDISLTNRDFGGGLTGWTVKVFKAGVAPSDLLSYQYRGPLNSYPAALLGEKDQDDANKYIDSYITQQFNVPNAGSGQTVWLDVRYSYCIATYETASLDKDEFWVEIRTADLAGVVDKGVKYTNLNPTDFNHNDCNPGNVRSTQTGWRRRGLAVGGASDYDTRNIVGDGMLWVNATEYKGDPLAIIFRDEVNESRPTYFYFDNISIRACVTN